jgi:flagellar hook-associated protein 2
MATTSGIGSTTIDVNSIVSQLMQVESRPLTKLSQKEAAHQAKLSAYGSLQGAISSFQSTMSGLASASNFSSLKATISDTSVLSGSVANTAAPGAYSIAVTKLAQGQKLVAPGAASNATTIGNGTLTFDFGTLTGGTFDVPTGKYTAPATFTSAGAALKTVTIDATNNTLSGIRDAINAANVGMTATIVNDGSATVPYRLVLTSTSTGAVVSARIAVTGDAGLSNLLAHDPTGNVAAQSLSQTLAAQNAALTVDGLSVSKASNNISDVIAGVTLNLAKETGATPVTLTIARDTSNVQTQAQSFVSAYNALAKTLKTLTGYNATTQTGGTLQGDPTARNVDTAVRAVFSTALIGAGAYTSLSQLGIGFQVDGTLAVDAAKLQAAVAANPLDVAGAFAQAGRATDGLVSYSAATSSTKPGSYAVTVTQVATRGASVGAGASAGVAGLTINGGNNTLEVALNGVTATVTLDSGVYATAEALALHVQSKINSAGAFTAVGSAVTVTATAGVITLTSNLYGSTSGVSVTGGNGASNLMDTAPVNATGVNVAGTINGVAATGSGQTLTGAVGNDASGLQLLVSGGGTGTRGTVNFSRGYAYQLNQLADQFVGVSGTISSRTTGINASIKDIGKQRDRLNTQLATIEKRYRAQFTALDRMMSSMNATSTYLSQQLANLPGAIK